MMVKMAWLQVVFTIYCLLLNITLVKANSFASDDGESDVEMRKIRMLLQKYGTQIESLQRENLRLQQKCVTLEEKVVTLEEKVVMFEQTDNPNPDQIEDTKPASDESRVFDALAVTNKIPGSSRRLTDRSVKKINKRVDSSSDSIIAFHAILAHAVSNPAPEHIIPFEKSIANIGGHFNPKVGVFTCVEIGVYQFSWMIAVGGAQYITTELVRNGVVIGSAFSGDGVFWTTGAATAITMLAQGDTVWVRVATDHSSGADISPTFTMFNGFLIK